MRLVGYTYFDSERNIKRQTGTGFTEVRTI